MKIKITLQYPFLFLMAILTMISCDANKQNSPEKETKTTVRGKSPHPDVAFLAAADPAYCNSCCTCSSAGSGNDQYKGKTINDVNFRNQDLTNYNFEGATLKGCRFDGANLTGVSFKGATFGTGSNGALCSFATATLDKVCFVNATLDSTDFQFTTFKEVDFRCANIFNGKFGFSLNAIGDTSQRTNFSYAIVGVGQGEFLFPLDGLEQPNWAATDFTNTKFLSLTPDVFHPAGKDMTDAKIGGINLQYYDMSQVNLTRADLSGAQLSFVKMDLAICYGANFSNASMNTLQAPGADFYDVTNGGSNFQGATLTYAICDSVDMQQSQFSNANMAGMQSRYSNYEKAVFSGTGSLGAALVSGTDFSYSNFSNAGVNNVTFSGGSKLIEVKFESTSTLQGTDFTEAVMPSISFYQGNLQDVNFSGAYLYNANFKGATLAAGQNGAGVNFSCAQLGGSDFSTTTISKVNFFNAVIPADSMCCPQKTGVYCGLVPWTGHTFGTTHLPVLTATLRCPNGDNAACSGRQWLWNPKNESLCNQYWDGSPWSKPADCNPSDTSKVVNIPDPKLKKCLQDQLFKGQDMPIDSTLAASVSSISCCCRDISDLTGLGAFTNLVYLNVESNKLTNGDFSNLSSKLQTLKVSDNNLSSIQLGSNQTGFTNLEASGNKINQIQGTSNIYFLLLDLSDNMLAGDWSAMIDVQTDLQYLDLSNNQLTSVGDLGTSKAKLATIYLQNNNLTTIGSMKNAYDSGNGSLYNLDLQGNNCFKCSTLDLPSSVVASFNCSCDTATCNTCN